MQRGLGCKCAGSLGAPGLALAYLTTHTRPLFLAHAPITYSSGKSAAARGASYGGGISCNAGTSAHKHRILNKVLEVVQFRNSTLQYTKRLLKAK
jgi:hypothetical protein